MKNKIIIAIAAAALSLPFAPAAFAHDRHDHGHQHREARHVVHFHLDGSRELYASSHEAADRDVAFLRSIGADARVVGDHGVRYHMHGQQRIVRYSAGDANQLADDLRRLGFHVHVDRE